MTNVRQILDHMARARCLYCGQAFKERKELVPHIANCTVYADYRSDVGKLREEVALQARRGDEALANLTRANETIAALQTKVAELSGDK